MHKNIKTSPGIESIRTVQNIGFEEPINGNLGFASGMVLAALPSDTINIRKPGFTEKIALPIESDYQENIPGRLMLIGISRAATTFICLHWTSENRVTQNELQAKPVLKVIRTDCNLATPESELIKLVKTIIEKRPSIPMYLSPGGKYKRDIEVAGHNLDIYDLLAITRNHQIVLPPNLHLCYFPKMEEHMTKKALSRETTANPKRVADIEVMRENHPDLIPSGIPEELLGVWESIPAKEKAALVGMDNELRITFIRGIRLRMARQDEEARIQGDEIRQAIMPGGQPQPEQLRFSFSPFPTQLTRTSPFFPLSTQELANREFMRDMVIASHSWGTLTYTGPKLSVYEEDYLMILLALLCDENARIEEAGEEGKTTYTYNGNIRQILKLKGIENPGSNYYKMVIDAFTLLSGASFKLTTKKTGKGKREAETTYVNNIISNLVYQHGSGDIKVSVNPYFYQTYGQGMVTWIDVQIRARLKKPHSKALYRFIMSHRDDLWEGPLLTLAASANIDLNLPKIKIRERLKGAIGELFKVGVLLDKSKINGDFVELWRVPRSKQKKLN